MLEGCPGGALELTEDPWSLLRSHVLHPQPPATPRAPPAADHPQAPNSGESSSSTFRLRPPRKLRPRDRKGLRAVPTRSQKHAPHLIARNFPPQLTNPKQDPDSRRRLPTSRPGQGSRGRAGRDPEKVAGSFVWEKWEGPGGGGTGGRLGISWGHSRRGACFGRDESIGGLGAVTRVPRREDGYGGLDS